MLFEELGFTYLGPIDGHDVRLVQETLGRALEMGRPVLIHAVTRKGKGYAPAEESPEVFHGVGPFDPETGIRVRKPSAMPTYTQVFSSALIKAARNDPRIVALTAAMMDGTGLAAFAREFPERTYDVGIAEECAVTLASGMALRGALPVVTIYSTFLQRAFDEISASVCLQNLHVVFAVDRGGLVGEDGSTHHGMFDLAYLRSLPNMRIVAPSDPVELCRALATALDADGPVAVRYPRGAAKEMTIPSEVVSPALYRSQGACRPSCARRVLPGGRPYGLGGPGSCGILSADGLVADVYDMRWVKPIDCAAVREACRAGLVVTLEEGTVSGGFGSGRARGHGRRGACRTVLRLGLPDAYVGHGTVSELFAELGLDPASIAVSVKERLDSLNRLRS